MDFLACPDRFPLWRFAPSSLRIAARRDDAGQRPHLVRGAAGCDRSRPVSDRHCHGRGLSESRRLGRVLILWRRQVAWSSAHRAPPSWLGVARKSEPSPDHSRITHSRHRTALGGHQRTPAWSISYSRGRRGSLSDTGGHGTDTVRDREAPGAIPDPPTNVSVSAIPGARPYVVSQIRPWPREVSGEEAAVRAIQRPGVRP